MEDKSELQYRALFMIFGTNDGTICKATSASPLVHASVWSMHRFAPCICFFFRDSIAPDRLVPKINRLDDARTSGQVDDLIDG